MKTETRDKLLHFVNRTGEVLGNASDIAAGALGTYLRQWLRFFWYGVIALMAGVLVGDPYRITGIVLGVSFVAEFSIAIATEFIDWRELLVAVAVSIWWPWRHYPNAADVLGEGIPTTSKAEARQFLMEAK